MFKLNPDDIPSYLRTVGVLMQTRRLTQARECLDEALHLVSKLNNDVKQTWLERINVQRNELSLLLILPCHINRLPNEILVRIAQFLDVGDRLTMNQTCTKWRDVISTRCLWTELIVTSSMAPAPRPA